MPTRSTKRGDERTPLAGSHDVLICGASFAGLTVARELAGSGADVLVVDRYEIGERQTSACAAPTEWLRNLGPRGLDQARPSASWSPTPPTSRCGLPLPFTFSTFDYRTLCELLWDQCEAEFETATVEGRGAPPNGDSSIRVRTDRGEVSAPLVVDALGWRRVLGSGDVRAAARGAALARARGPPRGAATRTSRSGSSAASSRPATAGAFPPTARCGSASAPSTPASTSSSRRSSSPSGSRSTRSATRATGSRTGCARRSTAASSSPATRPATACR